MFLQCLSSSYEVKHIEKLIKFISSTDLIEPAIQMNKFGAFE